MGNTGATSEPGIGQSHQESERLGFMAHELWSVIGVTTYDWEEGVERVVLPSDTTTLFQMSKFEVQTTDFCFESAMPPDQGRQARHELSTGLAVYHEALPFSEGERRWLSQVCNDTPEVPVAEEMFRLEEAEVITAGVRRTVKGGDLTRRWWSWRRQTDEFIGQGSLDAARLGLDSIAKLFLPRNPTA
jgi:hypothetical protein